MSQNLELIKDYHKVSPKLQNTLSFLGDLALPGLIDCIFGND